MQKDSLVVGRGGSAAWVDVQVVTTAKVSREHVRIRREPSGRFLIQDVSLWGTSVNGEPLPPAVKTAEGVLQPGAERELPPRARIDLGGRGRDPVRGGAMTDAALLARVGVPRSARRDDGVARLPRAHGRP